MIKIKINGTEISVAEGSTILAAAEKAGIFIPTMCFHKDLEKFTSCMICMVKEIRSGKLLPGCSCEVQDGMNIITEDQQINDSRKTALELMLSEHVGDCEAPCQIACPAHMDIPLMNRLLASGKINEAFEVVIKDIALPSVLGRICPAPCEGACKRKPIDGAVSICLLKRYAGDYANVDANRSLPELRNEKVAIIGSGPAGLAAAYYLQLKGIRSAIFDKNKKPGGMLRYRVPDEKLDKEVLNREIEYVLQSGIEIHQNKEITKNDFSRLIKDYQAVIIAAGDITDEIKSWGLDHNEKQVIVNKQTYQTSVDNVFAVGNVNRHTKLAIRSLGQGKEVAFSVEQFLDKKILQGEPGKFNSKFGKLLQEEYSEYVKDSVSLERIQPDAGEPAGYSPDEVKLEASRCMHCDCRKIDNCKLRDLSEMYGADQKKYVEGQRKKITIVRHHSIVYEPQKCIKCGICVRITEKHREKFGFTFIGRGFNVQIGTPFNKELGEALTKTSEMVADACPTGALSTKK